MHENRLYLALLLCATAVLLSFSGCAAHTNLRISRAIAQGTSPFEARCAFAFDVNTAACATVTISRQK